MNTFAWIGTALQIIGAIALATRILAPRPAYMVMTPGALIWLGIAIATLNWPLAAMQATFATINIIGIVRWKN